MGPDPLILDIQAFLEKASRDLRTAELMAEEPGDFRDIVCFHAQQCAEKSLKAVLLAQGADVPRNHDLELLLGAVSGVLPSVETLSQDCTLLTDFGVAPRYPGWEPVSGVIEVGEVLAAARRLLEWARLVACRT